MPGVIAAEDVVGTEGFALGGCGSGVAGFALSPGTGDGATGVTAAGGLLLLMLELSARDRV